MKSNIEIAKEIREDIDHGIYLNFPKLQNRLTFIGDKLFNGQYIINNDYKLTRGELETLAENTYIDKEDIEFYLKQ